MNRGKVSRIDYAAIAAVLSSLKCEIHNASTEVTLNDDGLGYTNVCCEDFENILDKEFAKQIEINLFGE